MWVHLSEAYSEWPEAVLSIMACHRVTIDLCINTVNFLLGVLEINVIIILPVHIRHTTHIS